MGGPAHTEVHRLCFAALVKAAGGTLTAVLKHAHAYALNSMDLENVVLIALQSVI